MNTRDILARDQATGRFLTGNGGGGRAKGSRNKLADAFVADVYAKWQQSGPAVLDRMIKETPAKFAMLVAKLIPAYVHVDENPLEDLPDEIIAAFFDILQERAAAGKVGHQPANAQPVLVDGVAVATTAQPATPTFEYGLSFSQADLARELRARGQAREAGASVPGTAVVDDKHDPLG